MKVASLLPVLLLLSANVSAYEIAIYTDQDNHAKAFEVIETFRSTYPFNTLDIEYRIVDVSAEQLNCAADADIDRLLVCNSDHVREHSADAGYDQALIVRDVPEYGGSGGGIPVISTGSDSRMMLHEYLHTLGLCDEYEYSASEAPRYCSAGANRPNMVAITPNEGGYDSDQQARSAHGGDIPWYGDILDTTLITNGRNLGTGAIAILGAAPNSTRSRSTTSAETGLYRGRTCDNMDPPISTWHPGGEPTIMDSLGNGLGGPTEEIVKEILFSRGATLAIDPFLLPHGTMTDTSEFGDNGPDYFKGIRDTARNIYSYFFNSDDEESETTTSGGVAE